jgi:hypothetical protein
MNLLLGIGTLIVWIISDILLGIKINKTRNVALKSLFISINLVFVIFTTLLLSL